MCAWIVQPIADLIEPVPAPVIWVDGIAAIDVTDGVLTIYSYVRKPSLHCGVPEIALELVTKRPLHRLPQDIVRAAQALDICFGAPPGRPPTGFVPRLVR